MNKPVYEERIRHKLKAALAPIHLEIIDDSVRHQGHAGHNSEGETHFRIRIVSAAFAGLSRVARHRLVYGILAEEIRERVHALTIDARGPDEIQL
jgi:BolA protein